MPLQGVNKTLSNLANKGTATHVLTSNGAGAAPTFQAAGGGLGYSLGTMWTSEGNPADGLTYFMARAGAITVSEASGIGDAAAQRQLFIVPKAGNLKAVVGSVEVDGTAGSGESVAIYIRINNTTDVAITTTATFGGGTNTFSKTDLSTAVVAGDVLEIKIVCPTWVTNPTTVSLNASIYIE